MNERRLEKSKIFSAVFLMASASIGPLFLMSTADLTIQFYERLAFVIIITGIIELGIQMNIWRILTVAKTPAHLVINKIIPNFGTFMSVVVLLGGIAFNIINISGLGIGISLLFNVDIKLGASIGLMIAILFYLLNRNRITLEMFIGVMLSFIIAIIILAYLFTATDVPYDVTLAKTVLPMIDYDIVTTIAMMVALSIGGYISFAGAHRLIDVEITGEKYKAAVTRSAVYSVIIVTVTRLLLFFTILGLSKSNVILFKDNLLESAFSEVFGGLGSYALGILFICASLTSIVSVAYTTGTFIKSVNDIIKKYIDVVLLMLVLTSWFIFLLKGEEVVLLQITTILNGLILPVILGGILHASRRTDIVGDYRHPLWLSIYGVLSLAVSFILVFVLIYDLI
ncbi:NRAMP family divalent metal transporter [Nosocomiicoccus ampullae]|uniref:NRAMP family divalent metal transporter n=1 Tax=Nosocomiicoccus ampullae TaxID=489910 RepID=UPI00254FA607|nr:divalent metal cation transporter [Nosocomiicoccus ampullae]MDK6863275.1 hypothetical protein [Nosocomiicoccus ampullae]